MNLTKLCFTFQATSGANLSACQAEAAGAALEYEADVEFEFNGKRYRACYREIVESVHLRS